MILENNTKIKELTSLLKKEKNVKEGAEKKMKDLDQKAKQDFYAFKTDLNTKHSAEIKEKQTAIDGHVS